MPVTLVLPSSSAKHTRCSLSCSSPSAKCIEKNSRDLTIGLVNNMPDGALVSTEQQFISLLNAASGDLTVNLHLYSLPGIARGAAAQSHIDQYYRGTESLWGIELDGLIVTGKEPVAANLADEPCWQSFGLLLEWARRKTFSTIWSCLAAHAAVLYMDGIPRVRSSRKHSGIFDSVRAAEHAITANLPGTFRLPHSRWNGLPISDLIRSGYQVLIHADDAEADCFVKKEQSLFLFFQSHPEYLLDTLLLEYRRDVARFLRGESSAYPDVPHGYFDRETRSKLAAIEEAARTRPHSETLAELGMLLSAPGGNDGWQATASTLYTNWLEYIVSEKRACLQKKRAELIMPQEVAAQSLLSVAALSSR